MDHIEQLSLYSNTTHVKNCALVYVGKSQTPPYDLEEDIKVHIVSFDLEAANEDEFKHKCVDFTSEIRNILNLLGNKN